MRGELVVKERFTVDDEDSFIVQSKVPFRDTFSMQTQIKVLMQSCNIDNVDRLLIVRIHETPGPKKKVNYKPKINKKAGQYFAKLDIKKGIKTLDDYS